MLSLQHGEEATRLLDRLVSRREIVSQRPLGLKIEGFAELSEVLNQQVGVHLSTMFQC